MIRSQDSALGEGRRALVTGATGFVGGALVRQLLANGWVVHALSGPRTSPEALATVIGHDHVHAYTGSQESVAHALAASQPDVVFHIASKVLVNHTADDIDILLDANVVFGTYLADAMVAAGVHRLVLAGSHWQHFNSAAYEPVNLYAATKQALQTILRYYTSATPLRIRIVTLFETYGPHDPRPKLLTLLKRAADFGIPLDLSPGEQLLDLVYIDDVTNALMMASLTFDAVAAPEVEYAASSGERISVRALVTEVEQVLEKPIPVRWGERPYRPREVMLPWTGPVLPGWHPKISLTEGLRATLLSESDNVRDIATPTSLKSAR